MNKADKIEYKYVYEKSRKLYRVVVDRPVYDKETKKTRHHYETVGKAKERGGEIEFGSKYAAVHNIEKKKEDIPAVKEVIPSGEVLVLEEASKEAGLKKTLVSAFGKDKADRIEALVFFLVCTGDAMMDAEEWCSVRHLKGLAGPRISELFTSLSDTACSSFFSQWVKEKAKDKSVCYDITSISTYATDMDIAEYGYNRDHEKWLRQINLAMVTDKDSHIPLAFRPLSGSLSDSQTLMDTIHEFEGYGAKPYGFVMDRGFWKKAFLDMMHEKGVKFALPVPSSVGWATDLIKEHKNDVFSSGYYEDDEGNTTFCYTVYDPQKESRKVWAHIYYSAALETTRREKFVKEYTTRKKELEEDRANEKYRAFYDKYFTVSKAGRGGKIHVTDIRPLTEILNENLFGYWVLYTDMEKDAIKALVMYRERTFIEAGFDDLKGATDMKRLRSHKAESVYGRLFVQFCAQILRTVLRNKIRSFDAETKKYASSPDTLLKRVKSYSKVKFSGKYKAQYSAPTRGQRLIFKALGIDYQNSSDDSSDASETERNFSE